MKKLDGQTIFAYMTGIDDKYIEEAAYATVTAPTAPERVSRWSKLSRAVNHPAGVAVICGIVALGVLGGIIWAGRNAPTGTPVTPPVGDTSITETEAEAESTSPSETEPHTSAQTQPSIPPEKETVVTGFLDEDIGPFSFTYKFRFAYGSTNSTVYPGEEIQLTTYAINEGKEFRLVDYGDTYYPHAVLRHRESGRLVSVGDPRRTTTRDPQTYTVKEQEQGMGFYTFTLSLDVPVGAYDLVLSYADSTQSFESVLTVEKNDTVTPGTLSSIRINGQDVGLLYQQTLQEYSGLIYLDQYMGSDGVLYEFHSGTTKLYKFNHSDNRFGSEDSSAEISLAEARELADAFMTNYAMIPDLGKYKVKESGPSSTGCHFTYEYYIGETRAWYEVMLSINTNGDIYSYTSIYWCENLPYITESDIEAAKTRFLEKYPQFSSGYSIYPYNDMLCVTYEDIVSTPVETDEYGNIIDDGHKHVFYTEVITPTSP